jgi:putative flippase GtrA
MNIVTRYKLGRYILFGAVVLLLTLFLTYLLTEIARLYYLYSYIIVLTVITITNFILNSKFVFKTRKKHGVRLFYYILSIALFYSIDIFLTKVLTDFIGMHYSFSISIAKLILFFTKFLVYNKFLFSDTSFLFTKNND